MANNSQNKVLISCVVPICIAHGWLAWFMFGLAFGYGESGEQTLAMLFGIASIVLAPLLMWGTPLTLLFSDNIAIKISVYGSAILWWTAIVWIVIRWQKRRHRNSDA